MQRWNIVLIVIVVLLLPLVIGGYSIGLFKIFAPVQEDVRRHVFENTKSYLHGVQQDLGKYYGEYQVADEEEKEIIRSVILTRFSEVDSNKLQSRRIQGFLIKMRGY